MRDRCRKNEGDPRRTRGHLGWSRWALALMVASACSSADDKFAAETSDEYTEPLTDEVTIGEPGGIVRTYAPGQYLALAMEDGGAPTPVDGGASSDVSTGGTGGAGPGSGGAAGAFGGGPATGGSAGAFGGAPPTGGSGGSFGGAPPTGGSGGSFGGAPPTGGTGGSFGGRAGGGGSFGGMAGSVGAGGAFGGSGGVGVGGSFGTGGAGGSAGKGGSGPIPDGGVGGRPDGGNIPTGPSGFWRFDDCSPSSNFLIDSSGNGAHATHALNRSCVPGITGLGVGFTDKKDLVQVADQPQFTLESRVAVAAWINPTKIDKDHPIVLKRLDNKTAFSFGIHKGNLEMSVVLSTGKTFISRAPIAANAWSHVAGMYDGRFVFIFINGEQVGQVAAAGTLRNVFAPIRIGATTQSQHFDGAIDDVWLSTNFVPKEQLVALSCIRRPSTVSIAPDRGGPVPFDTPVNYQINVTNNDVGACSGNPNSPSSKPYQVFFSLGAGGGPIGSDAGAGQSNAGINAFVNPQFAFVNQGATGTFSADVVATEGADPGLHRLPLFISSFSQSFEQIQREVLFEVSEPTGCFVRTRRELMITNTSVVDDPVRTAFNPSIPAPRPESRGVWTFGRLMRDMARTPEEAPAFTEHLFRSWLTDQTVNGFTIFARPEIQRVVLNNWPRTPNGELDLDRSPLTLLAIVNRIDERDLAEGNAGEGRFVFGVMGPFGNPEQFTVIVEYKLLAQTEQDVLDWANQWHALSTHPFPSEAYNAALEALTLRFSGRNSGPGRVNGNALGQLRTNDFALVQHWELREFTLSEATGMLEPATIKLTPDLSFNGSQALANYVNQNEAAVISETHVVPGTFEEVPFATGSVFNDLIFWSAPGIFNNEARHKFSLNTCNGCHGPESGTTFLMINPRFPGGGEAFLSGFLTGTTVFDPFSGETRQLNDLTRRRADLNGLVCAPPTLRALKSAGGTSIAKGIKRVH